MLESSCVGWAVLSVVVGFVFGWWDVSDGFEDALVVEPVDPFEGGVFDVVESVPRFTAVNDFDLVEAVDRLGHCIVVGIADGTDRRFDAGIVKSFGVADR